MHLIHPSDLPAGERMKQALDAAWRDIEGWIQLAKAQREEGAILVPTPDAIAFSELVVAGIQGAIAAYLKTKNDHADSRESVQVKQ